MAPMTNAERQKKYRERLKNDQVKYEELRKKHLERVKSRKVNIKNQSENQKRETRKKWKEYSARYYAKIKGKSNKDVNQNKDEMDETARKFKLKVKRLQYKLKLYKDAMDLSLKNNERMRKQIYRLKQQINRTKGVSDTFDTVNEENKPTTPSEFEVFSESLASVYKESTQKEKDVLKKVIKNKITTKHRMTMKFSKAIGLKGRIRPKVGVLLSKRKLLIKQIHNFYLRDDISRSTAGKKECKTMEKNKVQIRYLTDTILNLHKIYKREGGKASYSTLLRHRPFYVFQPKLQNRDTCACIRHANINFKILKLYKLGFIKTKQTDDLLKQIACRLESKACMYGECESCATKRIDIAQTDEIETTVSWLQWCLKLVPYKKKNSQGVDTEMYTKKFLKEIITDELSNLLQKFLEEIRTFKKHYYNVNHQQKAFRECVDHVKENEAIIIVDFSENYLCKYNHEIQGMHFGSSRNQCTLHTGVAYLKNEKPDPFCSISPNNEHSPLSIWAHLQPILNKIKYQHPELNTLHVFSDGPTTQYRQKINFDLFSRYMEQMGFDHSTWSYFEASHGKNAADGIGGVLKRTLDMYVAYGSDVTNAFEAFNLLKQKSTVTLFYVTDRDIELIKKLNPMENICPLKGTMTVHQIITTDVPGKIRYRHVSCFCGEKRGSCACFDAKEHNLINREITESGAENRKRIGNNPTKSSKESTDNGSGKIKSIKKKESTIKNNYSFQIKAGTSREIEKDYVKIRNTDDGSIIMKSIEKNECSISKSMHKYPIVIKAGPSRKIKKDDVKKPSHVKQNTANELKRKSLGTIKQELSTAKKGKIGKENRITTKRRNIFEDTTSESDQDIVYDESDDSPWNEESQISPFEDILNDGPKVTILSDVRLTPENKSYFDLKKEGPFKLNFGNYVKHDLSPKNTKIWTNTSNNDTSDEESIF